MRRGFTLIELMIVISVMAILIGIALPHFKGMQDEGKSARAAGELRTLATAVESWNIHNTGYPSQTVIGVVKTTWQETELTLATPTIVLTKLTDPFDTGAEYRYSTSGDGTPGPLYYVVFSVGIDGTADVTGIDAAGLLTSGTDGVDDDIYISNGADGVSF